MRYQDLDPPEVQEYLRQHPDAQIVDVREPWEFEGGRVPGARLMPLGVFQESYAELDPARPVVVVCAAGVRSAMACSFLAQRGFGELVNLAEGTYGWAGRGLPLEG